MSGIDLDIKKSTDNKTHTTFKMNKMKWYETITFHNWDREEPLTVTIQVGDGNGPVFDGGDTVPRIPGKGSSKAYKIRADYDGTYFKYTAQIRGTTAEDPIVIIEK